MSSGPVTFMTITLKVRIILENIWRRVVGNVQINISPLNIFLNLLLPARFHQNDQAVFGHCEYQRLNMLYYYVNISTITSIFSIIFEGKMFINTWPTTLLQILHRFILNSQVTVKRVEHADDNFLPKTCGRIWVMQFEGQVECSYEEQITINDE